MRYNLTDQILYLFSNDHEFEFFMTTGDLHSH
jgi:hypothetical protein